MRSEFSLRPGPLGDLNSTAGDVPRDSRGVWMFSLQGHRQASGERSER